MNTELSEALKPLINDNLSDRGLRGPKSSIASDVVFVFAAEMAITGKPWREFDIRGGNRKAAAVRVKRWIEAGELDRLRLAVVASASLGPAEVGLMLELIEAVETLSARVRSVKGRSWTQRKPRKQRKESSV